MTGLFVSKEHRRRSRIRTHKAYRFGFYILFFTLLVQIPYWLLREKQSAVSESLAVRKRAALDERARISAMAAPLEAMEQRIEEARGWNAFLSQRTAVSEILSRVERTVSEDICLAEVSVQNGAVGLRDADSFEVELRGFLRAPEPGAWQRELQRSFSDWTVSVSRGEGPFADLQSQGHFPVKLILKQVGSRQTRGAIK